MGELWKHEANADFNHFICDRDCLQNMLVICWVEGHPDNCTLIKQDDQFPKQNTIKTQDSTGFFVTF
jgi:hypothetical protein